MNLVTKNFKCTKCIRKLEVTRDTEPENKVVLCFHYGSVMIEIKEK